MYNKNINKISNRMFGLAPTVAANLDRESNSNDFIKIKNLGVGGFGSVDLLKHKGNGQLYAIKQMLKESIKRNKTQQIVARELQINYKIKKHPNIVNLLTHFEDEKSIYLVMEYVEGMELYRKLMASPGKKLQNKDVAHIIAGLCNALQHQHDNNIIHRDIKPENIYITKNNEVKLLDFGWSQIHNSENKNEKRQTYAGTQDYLAPEMIDEEHKHDHTVDVWCTGILTYELLCGFPPFTPNPPMIDDIPMLKMKTKENILRNRVTQWPNHLEPTVKDLIRKILKTEPERRYKISQILSHAWITKFVNVSQIFFDETDESRKSLKGDIESYLDQNKDKWQVSELGSIMETYGDVRQSIKLDSIMNVDPMDHSGINIPFKALKKPEDN